MVSRAANDDGEEGVEVRDGESFRGSCMSMRSEYNLFSVEGEDPIGHQLAKSGRRMLTQ